MGITWQQCAYNQPPHLGYYLPDYVDSFQGVSPAGIEDVAEATNTSISKREYFSLSGTQINKYNLSSGVYIMKTTLSDGKVKAQKILIK
jgi:hypothetical protein